MASVRFQETHEELDRCGFSRAVSAEETEDASGGHAKIESAQCMKAFE
jgi:hypothetical protein